MNLPTSYLIEKGFMIQLYIQIIIDFIRLMGCTASDNTLPSSSSGRSPALDCLTEEKKNKVREFIKKDDIIEFAILLKELQIPLNSEVSDAGSKWMMTHLCCRYDADNCLEYLVKNQFVENSSRYIDFVNAPTVEGYTALHLCALWKSQKCFNVLYYYGGLHLNPLDKNRKNPHEIAMQYNVQKMVEVLGKNKEVGIGFTIVETERLTKGDIITEDPINQRKKFQIDIAKIEAKANTAQTEEERKLKEEKKRLEAEKERVLQQKIRKELQAQQKKQEIQNAQGQKKPQEKKKSAQVIKIKQDEGMKAERENFNKQIKSKDEEIKKVKDQLRALEERQINDAKMEAERAAVQYSKEKEHIMQQKMKDKDDAIAKLKTSKIDNQNNPGERFVIKTNQNFVEAIAIKPQKERQAVKNVRAGLQQSFNQLSEEVPAHIQQLYEKAKQSGKFVDNEFPAKDSSIGNKSNQNFANFKSTIIWLRPSEIFEEGAQIKLFDGIDPNDIKQGQLGVCYLLATLSSLASNPHHIKQMFIFSDIQIGFYVMKLFINGQPKYFVIDDLIPCNKSTNYPIFTQPVGNELWVMLVQKCWAKAIGSYLSAEGMVPDEMFQDLTGSPGLGGMLQQETMVGYEGEYEGQEGQEIYEGQQVQEIYQAQQGQQGQQVYEEQQQGEPGVNIAENVDEMTRYSNQGKTVILASKSQLDQSQGIVGGHAYTLLKVFEINKNRIFKIRNPWANFQWKGQYSEGSKTLTNQIKKEIGYTNEDDGIFFMSEAELLTVFSYYSANILLDTHYYNYLQFKSSKNQDKFFTFTLTQSCLCNVRITQKFDRMIRDKSYKYSSAIFELGKIQQDGTVTFISEGDGNTLQGAKSVHAFEKVVETLDAGQYFVRIRMEWVKEKKYNTAVLSVYAPEIVNIEQVDHQTGIQYLKQLFISYSLQEQRETTEDGLGFYKIITMKSQFIFVAEVEDDKSYLAQFQFTKGQMKNTSVGIGKISKTKIQVPVAKDQPGVGTCSFTSLKREGQTGDVFVTFLQQ